MFHLYYTGCVFVYLMYIYLSSEINIYLYLSIYLSNFFQSKMKKNKISMTISKAIGHTFVNNGETIDVKISPIG